MDKKQGIMLIILVIAALITGSIATAIPTQGDVNPIDAIWERLLGIEGRVDDLETELDLMEKINALETRIAILENCDTSSGALPDPYVDSGWMPLEKGDYLIFGHGIGSLDYVVELQSKYDIENGDPISPEITNPNFHNWDHGGDWLYNDLSEQTQKRGVWYEAYENTVVVYRAAQDPYSDEVRIRIWKTN